MSVAVIEEEADQARVDESTVDHDLTLHELDKGHPDFVDLQCVLLHHLPAVSRRILLDLLVDSGKLSSSSDGILGVIGCNLPDEVLLSDEWCAVSTLCKGHLHLN